MTRAHRLEEAGIPTASMADIAFLLIVFFMLTTVFSANRGIEHLVAKRDQGGEPQPAIFIRIFADGRYEMDGQSYPLDRVDEVFRYVAGKLQINQQKPIILMTERDATYGDMIKVLDQLKRVERTMEPDYVLPLTIPNRQEAETYAQMKP